MNVLTMKFPAGRYALLSLAAFLFSAGVPVSFSGEKTAPPGSPVPESIDLNGTWLMKDFTIGVGLTRDVNQPGKVPADAVPIRIPGTVRKALLEAGDIPDPYYGYDNEKSLWVEQKEWWFFKTFTAGKELKGKYIDLVFEGASFQGEVWVNGTQVGDLKGMLNPRSFDVSGALKYGEQNSIAVRLEATPDARVNLVERGLTWDSPRDQLYSIAQCMYGWDWGPHGVPVGLWRPVRLRVSGPVRIDNPYITSHFTTVAEAVCTVETEVRNLSDTPQKGNLEGEISEEETGRTAGHFADAYTLAPGETRHLTHSVTVNEPRLWWPNGMGKQNLYRLREKAWAGGAVSESTATSFGIRELKLVENENVGEFIKKMKIEAGNPYQLGKVVGSYPWTFLVNGRKMFARGGTGSPSTRCSGSTAAGTTGFSCWRKTRISTCSASGAGVSTRRMISTSSATGTGSLRGRSS